MIFLQFKVYFSPGNIYSEEADFEGVTLNSYIGAADSLDELRRTKGISASPSLIFNVNLSPFNS